jgi:hypothetical protein
VQTTTDGRNVTHCEKKEQPLQRNAEKIGRIGKVSDVWGDKAKRLMPSENR